MLLPSTTMVTFCIGASALNTLSSDLGQQEKVPLYHFYASPQGHRREDLQTVYDGLKAAGCKKFAWLAGDSTLDNKEQFFQPDTRYDAVNGYQDVLLPAKMHPDVNYLLNERLFLAQNGTDAQNRICAINTARAGSTLGTRIEGGGGLYEQDEFLRDHVSEGDVVIVSVGGNDLLQAWQLLLSFFNDYNTAESISMLTPEASPKVKQFVDWFNHGTAQYLNKLREKGKPTSVIVCSPYYYTETPAFAQKNFLMMLALSAVPAPNLQAFLRLISKFGTSQIQLDGAHVEHIAMYETINGKIPTDYSDGIHLSEQGGRKMVEALFKAIQTLAACRAAP